MGAPDITSDYFALFSIAPFFDVDMSVLEQRFHELQARVHPDKHTHLSEAEQRVSMQWATRANEAFQILKSPIKRAQYLLQLRGVDPQVERNTAMPMEFLVQQLECREAVAEARSEGDMTALETLQLELRREMKSEYVTLQREFDVDNDNEAAAQTVRRLLFKDKLLHEIGDAIEAVESL